MPAYNPAVWRPRTTAKQDALAFDPRMYLLASGPRKSTKTFGNLHAIAWFLWNQPDHAGLMLGRTLSDNLNEGCWTLFTEKILPDWFGGGFGFCYQVPPRTEQVTHRPYFIVRNRFHPDHYSGPPNPLAPRGLSRFYLASLKDEREVERYKQSIFGLIYMPELSQFKQRNSFDQIIESLRVPGWREEAHRFLADTNPAEEGEDSWLWKLWYWQRTVNMDALEEDEARFLNLHRLNAADRAKAVAALKIMQARLCLHEFTIDDNPWMTPSEKSALFGKYAHNQDLLNRYYYGRWTKATGTGLFANVWNADVHVIGHPHPPADPNESAVEILLPEEDCTTLQRGFDLGPSYSSVSIVEEIKLETETGLWKPAYKLLGEVVHLGELINLSDLIEEILTESAQWEKLLGRKLRWEDWSDQSAFVRRDLASTALEHQAIFVYSKKAIKLRGVPKPAGSVDARVDLMTRLLFENRFTSSTRCPHHNEMFERVKAKANGKLDRASIHKHCLDSLTYILAERLSHELRNAVAREVRSGRPALGPVLTRPI